MIAALLLLATTALAHPLDAGWWHLAEGRYEDAARLALPHLSAEAPDLEAWRLYVAARARLPHPPGILVDTGRDLRAVDPADPVHRAALAIALVHAGGDPQRWCAEALSLLEPLPAEPTPAYWALRARRTAHARCGMALEADETALLRLLAGHQEVDRGWRAELLLRRGPVDPELARTLRRVWRRWPARLGSAARLWRPDAAGPALARARRDALRIARRQAARATVPEQVAAAAVVFEAAARGDPGLRAAARTARVRAAALAGLPPPTDRFLLHVVAERDQGDPRAALRSLEDLLAELGDDPPPEVWRAIQVRRMARLDQLGRPQEARRLARQAMERLPGDLDLALAFAWRSALARRDLPEALEAADRAIGMLAAERPGTRGGATDEARWRAERRRRWADALDTRAWVLHAMGRDVEAEATADEALTWYPFPDAHARMGLILLALERPDEALHHFEEALAGGVADPGLRAEVRRQVERLAPAGGRWHPGGPEGYAERLARRAPARGSAPAD